MMPLTKGWHRIDAIHTARSEFASVVEGPPRWYHCGLCLHVRHFLRPCTFCRAYTGRERLYPAPRSFDYIRGLAPLRMTEEKDKEPPRAITRQAKRPPYNRKTNPSVNRFDAP